jgi:hypothetical protein
VGLLLLESAQRFLATGGPDHGVPFGRQKLLEELDGLRLIVHDQDFSHGALRSHSEEVSTGLYRRPRSAKREEDRERAATPFAFGLGPDAAPVEFNQSLRDGETET